MKQNVQQSTVSPAPTLMHSEHRANEGIFRSHSLRRRLLFLFAIVLLIALALISVGVAYFVFLTEQQAWQGRQLETARNAGKTVAAFIERIEDSLTLVTVLDRDYLDSNPQVLSDILQRNPAILEIVRLDENGLVFASASQDRAVLANLFTIQQSNWFLQAAAGKLYLGDIRISTNNEPYMIVAIPAADGVVAARLRMIVLWNVVAGIRFGETGSAYLVSRDGQILAHPNTLVVLERNNIAGRPELTAATQSPNSEWHGTYINFQGARVVGTTASVPDTDWIVVAELLQSEAFAISRTALLLLGGGVLLFGALLMAVTIRLFGRLIFRPLEWLQIGTKRIGQGDLDYRIDIAHHDEIGQVAAAFNQMAAELQELYGGLEQKVFDRTERLEIIAALGERFSAILNLDRLLVDVVNQVKESFGYYHAHIYLLDKAGEKLAVAAGTGPAGAEMKTRGHAIPLAAAKSLVARAARTGQVVKIDNVREAVDWLPNPLLPDTYAEMAVPIIAEGQVVGVLDVQDEEIAGLDDGDVKLLRSLASQIAVAIRNARLFQEARVATSEAESLNRRLTRQTWRGIGENTSTTGYVFTDSGTVPDTSEWLPTMQEAIDRKRLIQAMTGNNGANSTETSCVALPLLLRGELIGVIGIERPSGRLWSEDELTAIQAVSEQVSLALDAARLAHETERTAWRDRVVSESTAKVWSSADIEEVMKAAVAHLGDKLRASEVVIRLGTEEGLLPKNDENNALAGDH